MTESKKGILIPASFALVSSSFGQENEAYSYGKQIVYSAGPIVYEVTLKFYNDAAFEASKIFDNRERKLMEYPTSDSSSGLFIKTTKNGVVVSETSANKYYESANIADEYVFNSLEDLTEFLGKYYDNIENFC